MQIEIRPLGADQHGEFVIPILTAFGKTPDPERTENGRRLPELTSRLGAFDGDDLVGTAGSYTLTMSAPGGAVAAAGLTMVAVLPTHRRQGILRDLMRRHLDDARAAKQPIAALWASEATIYGRFGYGLASQSCSMSIERDRTLFAGAPLPPCRARAHREGESTEALRHVWDRAAATTPGMLHRSDAWWRLRRLFDNERLRQGAGPLQRVVIEVDGRPEAYALYRQTHRFDAVNVPCGTLQVVEAVGASPVGTRLVWRYLFDVDLMHTIEASLLPIDHPLTLIVTEPRRLRFAVTDGLWVRVVDVEAALAARAYGAHESIVLEVDDPFCPWNSGRFRLSGEARRAQRTSDEPDLRLDVSALGAAYLGGISFRRLFDAGRIGARTDADVERADRLFRSARAPWCPEIF